LGDVAGRPVWIACGLTTIGFETVIDEGSNPTGFETDLVARMTELERRLDAADSRFEILDVEGRYSRTWDAGAAAEWADLFTEDGIFEIAAVGGEPSQRVEGRAALEQMCRDFTAVVTGLHLLHLPEISVRGDVATSRIHFEFRSVRRDAKDHTQQASVSGYYETSYRRTHAGWRIVHRVEKAVSRQRAIFYDL
jgi:ketosteroid isomerase-like protein